MRSPEISSAATAVAFANAAERVTMTSSMSSDSSSPKSFGGTFALSTPSWTNYAGEANG